MTKNIVIFTTRLLAPILFCLTLASGYAGNASNLSEEGHKFVETLSQDTLKIITSDSNAAQKEEKLSALFVQSVDTKWIAMFAMGKYWREATEKQRNEYVAAHKKFLLRNYIPKFKEYTNQEIKITKAFADSKNERECLVETQIISKEGGAVNVAYKIRKGDKGEYMIFDVIAEGVSLITTERADFSAILSRGGISELIQKLGEKI